MSEIWLAVDPGADAGWARFDTARLEFAGLNWVNNPLTSTITHCVVERPMIYPGGRQKARPADIIKLATRAGEWVGQVKALCGLDDEHITYVEPHKWKGTISKEICHSRIWAVLSPDERATLDKCLVGMAMSKRHNVLDAVGIGLWAVKRLGR